MKRALIGAVLALTLLLPGTALAQGNSEDAGQKHTICHATGSETNPYVKITPSEAGVFNGHLGDHQDGEDIIPPFEYQGETYSQNWPEGQAIFENDCEVPVVTTTTVPKESTTTAPAVTTTNPSETSTVPERQTEITAETLPVTGPEDVLPLAVSALALLALGATAVYNARDWPQN